MRGLFHHSFTHFSRCAKQYHNARTYTNIFYEHGEQPACQCLRVRKAAPLNKCEQASKRMNVPLRLCLTKRIFLQNENENENQEEPNTSIRKASKQKSVILEAIKISESNSSFIAPKRKPTKRQSQNLTEFKNEIRLKRLHKAHTKKNKQTNSHTCTSSQRFAQTHTHIHTHTEMPSHKAGIENERKINLAIAIKMIDFHWRHCEIHSHSKQTTVAVLYCGYGQCCCCGCCCCGRFPLWTRKSNVYFKLCIYYSKLGPKNICASMRMAKGAERLSSCRNIEISYFVTLVVSTIETWTNYFQWQNLSHASNSTTAHNIRSKEAKKKAHNQGNCIHMYIVHFSYVSRARAAFFVSSFHLYQFISSWLRVCDKNMKQRYTNFRGKIWWAGLGLKTHNTLPAALWYRKVNPLLLLPLCMCVFVSVC